MKTIMTAFVLLLVRGVIAQDDGAFRGFHFGASPEEVCGQMMATSDEWTYEVRGCPPNAGRIQRILATGSFLTPETEFDFFFMDGQLSSIYITEWATSAQELAGIKDRFIEILSTALKKAPEWDPICDTLPPNMSHPCWHWRMGEIDYYLIQSAKLGDGGAWELGLLHAPLDQLRREYLKQQDEEEFQDRVDQF